MDTILALYGIQFREKAIKKAKSHTIKFLYLSKDIKIYYVSSKRLLLLWGLLQNIYIMTIDVNSLFYCVL